MNLFRQINRVVNTVNYYGSKTNMNNMFGMRSDKISDLLKKTTYTADKCWVIQKAIRQVLNVYTSFDVENLSFEQNGKMNTFIEITGTIMVQNRGTLEFKMMFPSNYPDHHPFVRILNPNINDLIISQQYLKSKSSSDPRSLILTDQLNSIINWRPNHSVTNIIIEMNTMMRMKYPFKKKVIFQNNQNNWGQKQWSNQNPPFVGNNQPKSQPQSQQSQSNSQWSGKSGNGTIVPPIPFHPNKSATQNIAKSQALSGKSTKILGAIEKAHQSSLTKIQSLVTIQYCLSSQQNYLRNQNFQMGQFLQKNSLYDCTDVLNFIEPSGEKSQQILQLTSSIKACEDCQILLEHKFNQREVDLDDFMKSIRKIEDRKFDDRIKLQNWMK